MSAGCENCTFRLMALQPEELPPVLAGPLAALSAKEEGGTALTSSEIEANLPKPACEVAECNLTLGGFWRYVTHNGDASIVDEISPQTAPGCTIRNATSI